MMAPWQCSMIATESGDGQAWKASMKAPIASRSPGLPVGSLVADVLVDVQVVLSGAGPRVVGPHGVDHELAELVWVGLP